MDKQQDSGSDGPGYEIQSGLSKTEQSIQPTEAMGACGLTEGSGKSGGESGGESGAKNPVPAEVLAQAGSAEAFRSSVSAGKDAGENARPARVVQQVARIGIVAGVLGALVAGWVLRKRWNRLPIRHREIVPRDEVELPLEGTGVEGWKTDLANREHGARGLRGLFGFSRFRGRVYGRRSGLSRVFSRKDLSETGRAG